MRRERIRAERGGNGPRAVLARRLRALRFVRGWSQERLAELSGLHRTYVSAIERQRCNLSLESMAKLAGALGVGVVELLDAGAEDGSDVAALETQMRALADERHLSVGNEPRGRAG